MKGGNFLWTTESEEAFQKMKVMLAASPVLTKLTLGTPLLVYLSVTDDVVSAAIVQEKEGNQCLIYFISRVLHEKASLTLKVTSRRLRSYFQGYHIVVRTDLPIRKILRKPDLAGRMVGWSVQLFEFDISFKKRDTQAVKAGSGFLFVDGASNQSESKARVIIEGPDSILVKQSLQFEFKANNNQVEYEVLLVRMKLAKELDA
ncbi:hypothetical protein CR513_52483, partial [Mucuna pruriens]